MIALMGMECSLFQKSIILVISKMVQWKEMVFGVIQKARNM